jgi:LysM repeat protein
MPLFALLGIGAVVGLAGYVGYHAVKHFFAHSAWNLSMKGAATALLAGAVALPALAAGSGALAAAAGLELTPLTLGGGASAIGAIAGAIEDPSKKALPPAAPVTSKEPVTTAPIAFKPVVAPVVTRIAPKGPVNSNEPIAHVPSSSLVKPIKGPVAHVSSSVVAHVSSGTIARVTSASPAHVSSSSIAHTGSASIGHISSSSITPRGNPTIAHVGSGAKLLPPTEGLGAGPVARKEYTVVAGNTLTGIAAQFGVSLAALEQANPQIGEDKLPAGSPYKSPWDLIHPGEEVNIPTASSAIPAPSKTKGFGAALGTIGAGAGDE